MKVGTVSNVAYKNVLAGLDAQQKINVISQLSLTETQRIGALASSGLSASELQAAKSSGVLATSQGVVTGTTNTFSIAMKGLSASIKSTLVALAPFLEIGRAHV